MKKCYYCKSPATYDNNVCIECWEAIEEFHLKLKETEHEKMHHPVTTTLRKL